MIKQQKSKKQLRKWAISLVTITMLVGQSIVSAAGGMVSTTYGRTAWQDGDRATATFNSPNNTIADSQSGIIYIADKGNNEIRMYDPQGTQLVTTLAGSTTPGYQDGPGSQARFNGPSGIALDEAHQVLYVSELGNNTVRAINLDNNEVTTVVGEATIDSNGNTVLLNRPRNIFFNTTDNRLYIADTDNHQIKVYDPATGFVDVFAGTGTQGHTNDTLLNSEFNYPSDITYRANSGEFYVTDLGNNLIRKIRIGGPGLVSDFAGQLTGGFSNGTTGQFLTAKFSGPSSISTDPWGNLYVADTGNEVVREIDLQNNLIQTIAGTDMTSGVQYGQPQTGKLYKPTGIRYNPFSQNMNVTNQGSNVIASFDPFTAVNSGNSQLPNLKFEVGQATRSGLLDAAFNDALFNSPHQMTQGPNGIIYVADELNHAIREILPDGSVKTLAGDGTPGYREGIGSAAQFDHPQGIVYDAYTDKLYVADMMNHVIRMINLVTKEVSTVAGDGVDRTVDGIGVTASLSRPFNLVSDDRGSIYIADYGNSVIRSMSVDPSSGYVISTFAGDGTYGYLDGRVNQASFSNPQAMTIDASRKNIYLYDNGKNGVRRISLDALDVVTIAGGNAIRGHQDGQGVSASFKDVLAMTVGSDNKLYITDSNPGIIRSVDLNKDNNGEYNYSVETLNGAIMSGYFDGPARDAQFGSRMYGILQTANGNLLIADTNNQVLRTYDFAPIISGVVDGNVYLDYENVTPTFNEGTGMLSFNGGPDLPFTSGTVLNPPGLYTLTVTDSAGNVSTVSFGITGVSSTPSIFSPALVNTSTPTIWGGLADSGDTIYIDITDLSTSQIVDSGTTVADASGNYSYQVSANHALGDGQYSVSVHAVDLYGTVSNTTNLVLTVDTIAPAAPVVTKVLGQNTSGPSILGKSFESDLTLKYTLSNGGFGSILLSGTTLWTIQLMSMQEGSYTATIWLEDAAGNASPTIQRNFVVDRTPPTISVDPSGLLQNTNTPTFTGTTEPDASVIVTIDGTEFMAVTADAAGHWSFTTPSNQVQDGAHALDVLGVDTVGWDSGVVSYAFNIDTYPPQAPVVTSPAIQNTHYPVLSYSAEPNTTLLVNVSGTIYTVQTDANGNWSNSVFPPTYVNDGIYSISAFTIDAAGNQSSVVNSTIEVDTTPPGAPSLSSNLMQNQLLPSFTGFADPGSVLTLTLNGKTYQTTVAGSGAWSIQLPVGDELSDGNYAIQITSTDAAGNGSPAFADTLFIDTVAPNKPVVTSGALFTTSTPTFTGTGEIGSTITVNVNSTPFTTVVLPDGTWTVSVPANQSFGDGTYLIKVSATDAAGNSSSAAPFNLTIDTTPPATATITSSLGQATATPTIKGTAEPLSTITIVLNGVTYSVIVDNRGVWNFDLPVTDALFDGTYPISVTVTDRNGLQSPALTTQLLVDTQAPALPTMTTNTVQNSGTPTLSGTAEPGSTVAVTIDGRTVNVVTDVNGNWTYDVPVGAPLADGNHAIDLIAYDALGNQGPTLSTTILVDTIPPTKPNVTSSDAQVTLTPTFAGTADPGSTVYVEIAGQTLSVVADGNGDWSLTLPSALTAGTFTADVYATDMAGNRSGVVSQLIKVRSASSVASLNGLTISDGKLSPAFNPTVFSYKASVKNATKSLVIQPGDLPAGAVVRVNGVLVAANQSITVALKSGISNKIGIEVTAEDGVTKVMYTLNVYRTAIKAYTQGFAGKNFRPDAFIKREEMAYMLDQLFTKGKGSKGSGMYSDIGQMYWAKKEIVSVAKKGVMMGFNNGSFGFGQKLTRGQLALIIARLAVLPQSPKKVFTDSLLLADGKVYAAVVEAGYMKAYTDGTFRPYEGVTRAEAIILLNKLSHREALTDRYAAQWNDVNTSYYAFADIQNASISR
jgi:sugar lactone lactonase YvrE